MNRWFAIGHIFPRALRWRLKRMLGMARMQTHPALDAVDFRTGSRVVFDVGAHLGNFAGHLLIAAPLSEVHCFEPNPELIPALQANCRRYGMEKGKPRAVVNGVGVGARPGSCDLIITKFAPASSMLPVAGASRSGWPKADFAEKLRVTVPVTTIKAYAEEKGLSGAKLLKMDVQGYELEILKGCGDFLHRIEYVYSEVQFTSLYENAPLWTDLLAFLREQGFRPEMMDGFCLGPAGEPLQADMLWRNLRLPAVEAPKG